MAQAGEERGNNIEVQNSGNMKGLIHKSLSSTCMTRHEQYSHVGRQLTEFHAHTYTKVLLCILHATTAWAVQQTLTCRCTFAALKIDNDKRW